MDRGNRAAMHRALIVLVIATVGVLVGCQKSSAPAANKPNDAVQQKLNDLAGKDATDCGRLNMQAQARPDALKAASGCALQAAQNKRPFYVAYEMPGLTIGVAGSPQGQLYSIQSQAPQPGAAPETKAEPCPAQIRVAESGRVTCFPPASFGIGSTTNPHAGMPMPPGTANPHAGVGLPAPGTPNPHGGKTVSPSKPGSATPPKQR